MEQVSLDSSKDIENIARVLLKESGTWGKFPTQVDHILQTAQLKIDLKTDLSKIRQGFLSQKWGVLASALRKTLGATFPSQKIIYLDLSLKPARQNFVKLHEVGHNVLVWQNKTLSLFEDDEKTLDPSIKELFEKEANYFSSCALFQLERFDEQSSMLPLELKSAMVLSKKFGSSVHAALRRYVESNSKRCALLVLEPLSKEIKLKAKVRNYFESTSFSQEFNGLKWPDWCGPEYSFIADLLLGNKVYGNGNVAVIAKEIRIPIEFYFHYFRSPYNTFIFLMPPGEKNKSKVQILVR